MSQNALLVFVKYPIPGTVKTRLVPGLTPEQAADLARAMAEDVLDAVSGSARYETIVCFTPQSAGDGVRRWLGPERRLQAQGGGDLGVRQLDAIRRALEIGFKSAVIIGSDCPTVTAGDIGSAFDSLGQHDVVIGPAEDGGYYLVGARRPIRSMFEEIPWGTERVLSETLERLRKAGLSFGLLDEKYDIDSYEDLERYYVSVRDGGVAAKARRSQQVIASILGGTV